MVLGEFDLIAKYFSPATTRAVLAGGDDCALLQPAPGRQLAISTDLLVEGRHFLSTVAPQRLGHKALAVNLSDLAACGARPLAFTLALSMPRVDEAFLAGFSTGLLALARAHECELIGGDTTAGPLTLCLTVFGEVPAGQALLRSGARVGDEVWVSHPEGGGIGDARLALEVFRGHATLPGDALEAVRQRMEQPQPRIALGLALRGIAHSAIDLSDGLAGDLGHVLRRSSVGATLQMSALPRSPALAAQPDALQRECLLAGGDDYELLFTAAPGRGAEVAAAARGAGVACARIGYIDAEPGLRVVDPQGRPLEHAVQSFDHFKT
jgi:thiamine-monophosphate kinase